MRFDFLVTTIVIELWVVVYLKNKIEEDMSIPKKKIN